MNCGARVLKAKPGAGGVLTHAKNNQLLGAKLTRPSSKWDLDTCKDLM